MKEKMLDVITKILTKAGNNPSKEEAETALLMAQRLMLKHGISQAEIDSFGKEDNDTIEEVIVFAGKKMNNIIGYLANVIAFNFKCKQYAEQILDRYRNKQAYIRIKFFGEKNDVEIAQKIFSHAKLMMNALSDRYVTTAISDISICDKRQQKQAYKLGFVYGLETKFKEQIQSNCLDLMLRPSKKVEEAYEELNCSSKKIKGPNIQDTMAYHSGVAEGKNYSYVTGNITE